MSAVIVLLSLILHSISCETLKCDHCVDNISCGYESTDVIIDCTGQCLTYQRETKTGTVVRRCCSEDICNGIESDRPIISAQMKINVLREASDSPLSCYDCSGHNPDCGMTNSSLENGCQACMVYLNVYDGNNVMRRCCQSNCGSPGTIAEYEGRQAYFCSSNQCNGIGAEDQLTGDIKSTTMATNTMSSTVITTTTTMMTTTISVQTAFSCYDCSHSSEQTCTTTTSNCPACMVHRNDEDPTKFDRRCCWWACGAPNQVTNYAGRPTYFCYGDECNRPGSESVLGYITTTTTIPTTPRQTSFQCYDCSGANCGKEGSALSTNCPMCMIYRNPNDQTQIERRCCWWACGTPNSLGTYDGREAYFCTSDKCNGYGAEFTLTRPVTTTTTMITTTATRPTTSMTTTQRTTSVSSGCILNCLNGGIPEKEDGCFCYCLEYTSGRECQDIDCAQADVDPDICSLENRALCEENGSFAFECRHLCGKC